MTTQDQVTEWAERYKPTVRAVFRRMEFQEADMNDLEQVVWTLAVRYGTRREGFADVRHPARWLYMLSLNVGRRHFRRRQRVERSADLGALPAFGGRDEVFEHAANKDALAAYARIAPPKEYVVFALRCGEGWTAREIAAELGLSAEVVRRRLRSARERLRRLVR